MNTPRSSIFSSNQAVALRAARRAGIFLIPALLLAAPLEWLLWRSGECWPVDWVAARQHRDPQILYARRYFDQHYNLYKLARIREEHPDILVIGSSRIMQVRRAFFVPVEGSFYNAGGILNGVEDLEVVARLIQTAQLPAPRVMVVGLDPWWFKVDREDTLDLTRVGVWRDTLSPNARVHTVRGLAKDGLLVAAYRSLWAKPSRPPGAARPMGLAGLLYRTGFRSDGSYRYQAYVDEYRRSPRYYDRKKPSVVQQVLAQQGKFAPAEGLDWSRVDRLLAVFQGLQARGIELYVVQPPLANEVCDALRQVPGLSAWMAEYFGPLPERLAREAGVVTVGAASPSAYGLPDDYMWDGYHPTEVMMSYLIEDLLRAARPASLLRRVDRARLQALRREPGVLPVVFPRLMEGDDVSAPAQGRLAAAHPERPRDAWLLRGQGTR